MYSMRENILTYLVIFYLTLQFSEIDAKTGLTEEAFVNSLNDVLYNGGYSDLSDPNHPQHDVYKQLLSIAPQGNLALNIFQNVSVLPNISQQCTKDMQAVEVGWEYGEIWAIQFLDAWGKLPTGLFQGASKWTGTYQQCMKIRSPVTNVTLDNHTVNHQFYGRYCNVYIGQTPKKKYDVGAGQNAAIPGLSTISLIGVGACIPDSCSLVDFLIYMAETLAIAQSYVSVLNMDCQLSDHEHHDLSPSAIAMICILSILGLLMVVGTVYDVFIYQPRLNRVSKPMSTIGGTGAVKTEPIVENDNTNLHVEDYTPLVNDENNHDVEIKPQSTSNPIARFFLCFSVFTNGSRILTVGAPSDATLGVVHGVRFFSMTWVMLGHTLALGPITISMIKNIAVAEDLIQRFSFQAILGATVSVDTFFLLSGLLVAYLSLREMKAKEGPRHVNWLLYYFHRFWRLTPPYMLVLGSYVALMAYMGSGPYWPNEDIVDVNCEKTWWTNLLYVNNLVKTNETCMGWSWYLANDMQFFVITPFIIIPFFFSGVLGAAITMTLMLGSFIASGVISSHNHYLPGIVGSISPLKFAPDFVNHTQTDWFNEMYIPPYTRIGPYLVGLLLGYLLYKTDKKVKLHWTIVVIGWIVATVLGMLTVYGLYGVTKGTATISNSTSALWNAVHRSVWAVAVSWVIFACATGYGGFVNTILSWNGLVPLSRLTYMAYLVHPVVIMCYIMQLKQTIIYDDFTYIYLFLANLVMSYMVAFVASLSFESPMMALEKLVFGRFK